jgi:hypothetical protein
VRFINLGEWREIESKRLIKARARVPCPTCNGAKEHEGQCDCCKHTCSDVCDDCDDDGTVLFETLDHWKRDDYLTQEKYEEAIVADATLLSQWVVRDLGEVLVESGFTPWQSVIYHLTSGEVTGFRGGALHLN